MLGSRMVRSLCPVIATISLVVFSGLPVHAVPPELAPPPHLPLPPGIDPALADWTPRPATGIVEPWEKAIEANWIDARFREMNTGPALNCTLRYPIGKGHETSYKATVVKLGEKGESAVAFDRCTMQVIAAWTGGYLNHSDRRFGLLNTPTPKGEMQYAVHPGAVWGVGDTPPQGKPPFTAPADPKNVRYRGHHLQGNRVVFQYDVGARTIHHTVQFQQNAAGKASFTETLTVGAGKAIVWQGSPDGKAVRLGSSAVTSTLNRTLAGDPVDQEVPILKLGQEPNRWGQPIVTKLERGNDAGPFAVDTCTIPYKNRFGALFFCTGVDHLPDGRVAVCTCHGDVWFVRIDESANTCSWQRFATGLYQPLGLKVVDSRVVVLERGQLTRLHDQNQDGEADFYECVNNDWHCGGGEHSYDTCLETDPKGNFYFFKTGDTHTLHGGCLLRVTRDGSKAEVFATGFRHPIGMGMSPGGILTGADQEGNWMPATRIDQYQANGFYGDMRAHHRSEPPKTYDAPLCWLPREVDNSAGGQVWVPEKAFGPLAGLPLHFSYGRCRPFVLLRQSTDSGVSQGGVAPLGIKFLSGVCRGRFGSDGHLIVCGLNGWQTAAQADGCLQRVRVTGKPLDVPTQLQIDGNRIRLTFSSTLEATSVADTLNYKAAWWNYRWSGDYGSKRWKVSNSEVEGMDTLRPHTAKLLDDEKTIELSFEKLQPVMQMQIGYNLLTPEGRKVVGSVYLTIHTTAK